MSIALIGDTNQDGAVNSGDVTQVKSKSDQALNASNVRCDPNVEGPLKSADISLVKSKSGVAIPNFTSGVAPGIPSLRQGR